MSKLLRYFSPGQYCFLTSVTHNREPILMAYPELTDAFLSKLRDQNTQVLAWVFLPDHLHILISSSKSSPSNLMKKAKVAFAYHYWQHSSFRSFLDSGKYEPQWGTGKAPDFEGSFGE